MSAGFAFTQDVISLGLPDAGGDGAGNGGSQPGWNLTAMGVMDQVVAAKYLVIETEGAGDNQYGFGGIHLIYQGKNDDAGINIDWTDVGLNGGWIGFSRGDGKTVSIAIDIQAALGANYDNFLKCSWTRFILAYYGGASAIDGLALKDVYLTADFAKPSLAVNLTGTTGFIFGASVNDLFGSGIILDLSTLPDADSGDQQKGWEMSGVLGKVDIAKYLVIETEGVGDNANGFSELSVSYQGGADGVDLGMTKKILNENLVKFQRAEGRVVSIAIDLRNVMGADFDKFLTLNWWARLIIGYYQAASIADLTMKNVYLMKDFAKPADAVDIAPGTSFGFIWSDTPPPLVAVTGVSLDQTTATLTAGNTLQLTAIVAPDNATNKNVTWSSSNTAVATVDAGLVTATGGGTATITVTTEDGSKTATCTVAVSVPVTDVSLDQTTATLVAGSTLQLTVAVTPTEATNKAVTWSSDKETVATVSATGLVTAVSEGTATITVTTEDGGKTAACTVTVTPASIPVTGVTLDQTTAKLIEGNTLQLTATVAPADATDKAVTWSSDDETVATVSATGLITAVSKGTATITVTTQDGSKTATCTVEVSAKTGISNVLAEISAYAIGDLLYIQSPVAEKVQIYSISGVLLQNFQKAEGKTSYSMNRVKGMVLIVKGSSGWTKKVIKN